MSDIDPRTASPEELRRWIAERLGWVIVKGTDHLNGFGYEVTTIKSPDGKVISYDEIDAGPFYSDKVDRVIPNWPADVEAALRDLVVDCFSLTKCDPHWPGAWEASIEDPRTARDEYPGSITEYADTPAMAICRWYVAYTRALETEP